MSELQGIRRLLKLLIAVVFVSLAIISSAAIVATRTSSEVKKISEYNQKLSEENKANSEALLKNFTAYMSCLVLRDQPLFDKLGREAYIKRCNTILFEGSVETPEEPRKPSDVNAPGDGTSTTTTSVPTSTTSLSG